MKTSGRVFLLYAALTIVYLVALFVKRSLDEIKNREHSISKTYNLQQISHTPSLPTNGTTNSKTSPTPRPINPAIGITFEEDQKIAPFPPSYLALKLSPSGEVILEWSNTGSDIVSYFNVYRSRDNKTWELLGQVKAQSKQDIFYYGDKSTPAHRNLSYVVTAVDVYGNESAHSASVYLQ